MEFHELVKEISLRTGISELKVEDTLSSMTQIIFEKLGESERVKIEKLGHFQPGMRKGRWTNEGYIPAHVSPQFIASRAFRGYLMRKEKDDKNKN